MINKQLLEPQSIVIVGASNKLNKPGGKILRNILEGDFKGDLFLVNPKEKKVQGYSCYTSVEEVPHVDLAILAIPAKLCIQTAKVLINEKGTKAFIVISAGFSEYSQEGSEIEEQLVEMINKVNGALIGPNCIGILTKNYNGVFTEPLPKMESDGVDLISGSGATAVFIMESGIQKGLAFSNVFTVGNSAQIGVEEVLEFMDENFNPDTDSKVKLLYLETLNNPHKFLKHSKSLIKKGCKIAAVKAGASDAGNRAASSHTGALAGSDVAIEALFKKAGIVRCYGRSELINVGGVLKFPMAKGKRFAIITHAGGPGVMLADSLSKAGLEVPVIENEYSDFLLQELYHGSSIKNPIDFLATGTAEQLQTIIEYVEKKFDEIDAMVVIFGTPGLVKVFDAYSVLDKKIKVCKKPIYPVLPSIGVAKEEIKDFVSRGNVYFSDEVELGGALGAVYSADKPFELAEVGIKLNLEIINDVIHNSANGYLSPEEIQTLLDACSIPRVKEFVISNKSELQDIIKQIGFPVVLKVVGPLHKSDKGGVRLNIDSVEMLETEFERMMKIEGAKGVLVQPMLSGEELFIGAKFEEPFGYLIMCGLGGIYVELLKDISIGLSPLSKQEVHNMLQSLKSYSLFKGVRGKEPVSEERFVEIVLRLNALLLKVPEIKELDFNPLLANGENITVVDARIRIEK